MFGLSFIALGCLTFLAVTTTALVLVFSKSENKGSCGCCAGCGLVAAILIALALGVGAVLLFIRHEHRGTQIRIQHLDADEAMERFEDSLDDLEERLERIFDE